MASAEQNHTTRLRSSAITSFELSELAKLNDNSKQNLYLSEYNLFNNSSYSDISIRLGTAGIDLPAHRIILASESPLLYEALLRSPETQVFQFVIHEWSAHTFWRVLQYMYMGHYSESPTEVLNSIEDQADLLKHADVVLIARTLRMPELEEYALERLRSQLHSWSKSDIVNGIQEMCTSQNKEARQLVVTEAARSCLQFPILAECLQKAAQEVEGFAIDLVEALGTMNRQYKDCDP